MEDVAHWNRHWIKGEEVEGCTSLHSSLLRIVSRHKGNGEAGCTLPGGGNRCRQLLDKICKIPMSQVDWTGSHEEVEILIAHLV